MGTLERYWRRQAATASPRQAPRLTRDELNQQLVAIYNECPDAWSKVHLPDLMHAWYGVTDGRHLTLEQLADLVAKLRRQFPAPGPGGAA